MSTDSKPVLVLGGGVTGMQVAGVLASLGHRTVIVEQADRLGGRVRRLSRTFPFFDDVGFHDGLEFVSSLERDLLATGRVEVRLQTQLSAIEGNFPNFTAVLSDGARIAASAIVVCTGFTPYDPAGLPEYGYGKIPNVITAPELEWMLNPRGPTQGQLRRPSDGKPVKRLAIVFCVGSRNRRIGAPFCSRICCSFSTKQATTVMERDPSALVACFYMDVRTYDRGFEEMYSLAQERGAKYIRGRVSACRALPDGSITVRAENTLIGRPFSGEFDMVSLSTGMRPCHDVERLAQVLGVERAPDGFFLCSRWFRFPHDSSRDGVFIAGCATGMKPIRNCMVDGASVAARVVALIRAAST
jgi:heterodisulfide reductase subunit A